jgi:hypothetical protein
MSKEEYNRLDHQDKLKWQIIGHDMRTDILTLTDKFIPKIKWYTFKFMVTRKLIEDGFKLPRRFGIAHRDFDKDASYFVLVPFNLIIALSYYLWWSIKYHWPNKLINSIRNRVYSQGYRLGYARGWNEAKEEMKQLMSRKE